MQTEDCRDDLCDECVEAKQVATVDKVLLGKPGSFSYTYDKPGGGEGSNLTAMVIKVPGGSITAATFEGGGLEQGEKSWSWDGDLKQPTISPGISVPFKPKDNKPAWRGYLDSGLLIAESKLFPLYLVSKEIRTAEKWARDRGLKREQIRIVQSSHAMYGSRDGYYVLMYRCYELPDFRYIIAMFRDRGFKEISGNSLNQRTENK